MKNKQTNCSPNNILTKNWSKELNGRHRKILHNNKNIITFAGITLKQFHDWFLYVAAT